MNTTILFVDDEENILSAFQRQLHRQFQIKTALGGEAALQMIDGGESFAIVISDLRMPNMDGIQLLSKIKEIAPDTVRMMLTGQADLNAAMDAVNQGNIFRFLTKPCPGDLLEQTLQAGLHQHRLITAEKELLEQTLKGTISVLTEILSILDAQSFGKTCALSDGTREIAKALQADNAWELELGAMLCEVGRATIPATTIARERAGSALSAPEQEMLMRLPEIGHKLLAKIPRLESVAQIILYQKKNFDGSGFPKDRISGEQIPLGSRILRILSDLNLLESKGTKRDAAFAILKYREGIYDPALLDCASRCLIEIESIARPARKAIRSITVPELEVGQTLITDIETTSGMLVIPSGTKISESLRERIRNFGRLQAIREPIKVETEGTE
jgi:response regulator RpfG family c-di-GMP phosphodiesterase